MGSVWDIVCEGSLSSACKISEQHKRLLIHLFHYKYKTFSPKQTNFYFSRTIIIPFDKQKMNPVTANSTYVALCSIQWNSSDEATTVVKLAEQTY